MATRSNSRADWEMAHQLARCSSAPRDVSANTRLICDPRRYIDSLHGSVITHLP
jgi:hypothetical protein